MTKIEITKLTTEELLAEHKKRKTSYIIGAFIVGMMFGVVFWSLIYKGFTIITLIPFVFAYWFRNTKKEYEEVKNEIQSRKVSFK